LGLSTGFVFDVRLGERGDVRSDELGIVREVGVDWRTGVPTEVCEVISLARLTGGVFTDDKFGVEVVFCVETTGVN
jgi:hypothetical protein